MVQVWLCQQSLTYLHTWTTVVVAGFNQEKALVVAFSVIVQLRRLIVYSTSFKYSYRSHVADKIDIY